MGYWKQRSEKERGISKGYTEGLKDGERNLGQGMQEASRSWKMLKKQIIPERTQLYNTLILRLLTLEVSNNKIHVILSHKICGYMCVYIHLGVGIAGS